MKNKSILGLFSKSDEPVHHNASLTEAHKKAQHIIETAVDKANEILAQTDIITSDLKSDVRNAWSAYLEVSAKDLQAKSQEMLQKVMEDFQSELMTDLKQSQALLQQKIADEFGRIEESLKEYEQSRKQQIDAEVEEKVKRLLQTNLSSAISPKDHETLVVSALQKAKKEGII